LHDACGDAGLRESRAVKRFRNFFADVDFPQTNPRLSVAIGGDDQVEQMLKAALGGLDPELGIRRFVKKGDVVVIKPNAGFSRPPHLGASTNPEVERWLIRLCREAGASRIIVTDNPVDAAEATFAKTKLGAVAKEEDAELIQPTADRFEEVAIRDGKADRAANEAFDTWPIMYAPFAEATKVIGVAPIKDHSLSSATMSMKNWYGLLGGRRNQLHQAIHDTVSDLGMMMSATLIIGDATRVMMRNGPTGGRVTDVKPGGELSRPAIIASVDPVACDAWCYEKTLGRDPTRLKCLELAERKIAARIGAGERRFGQADWRAYDSQGLLKTTTL
ncbi:MAG: DUF362 domain-containing protein, partial [Phycisphaerae bacterium]|nr:DUF362 domain-containing protein [Phycisphaerae bacterium]